MKKLYFFAGLIIITYSVRSQAYQQSIGGLHSALSFNSVQYDQNDGGTINAGYLYDSTREDGRDWLLVKLDQDQNVVWQKVIRNSGDDFLYKVIVCANGDYVAVGVLTQDSVSRGFICRINSSDGNIIWSSATANSLIGEIYYDVVETANRNIVVAGTDKWVVGNPDSFIILFDSTGKTVWSEISQYAGPDQPYSISQLPNGNLIVGITEWVSGEHYNLIILELKEKNGKIVAEKTYSIDAVIPNTGLHVNSLSSWGMHVRNGEVTIYCFAFQGSGSTSSMCIYTYNKHSGNLSGNMCYHINDVSATSFAYTPLNKNDYLIGQSFTNPARVYISRITNGYVVYDDLVEGSVTSINGIDTTGTNVVYCGSNTKKHVNAYDLFAVRTDPVTTASCRITASRTLVLMPSSIVSATSSDISFAPGGVFTTAALTYEASGYHTNYICGSVSSLNNSSLNTSGITAANLAGSLFSIYPNPSVNNITVNIPFSGSVSTLNIYNLNGEKMLEQRLEPFIISKELDISKFKPGVYNVVLVQATNRFSLKLIKK